MGAGIVGLYLASKLKGQAVTVFEKRDKIGKVACSGLFSERILDYFPQSRKLVRNEINSVLIHFPKRTVEVRFSRKFLVMNHAALDQLAAEKIPVLLNSQIKGLPQNFDRVIGCDGANSFIRKSLRVKEPSLRLGILGFVDKKDDSSFVEAWPVESGFIWKIPRGREQEYGILAEPKKAKKLLNEFLAKNKIKLKNIEAGSVPQGLSISHNPGVALAGDAAGLTKPWTGGGVIWGLKGADILLRTFPDFNRYRKELKRYFLPKIILAKIAVSLVYFLGFNFPRLLPKSVKIESDFLL